MNLNTHKYKTALFIGRFQPFHKGHLYSLKKCLEIAESVKIVVAKSNVWGTENDPWRHQTRIKMVRGVVKAERIEERVTMITSCPDNPSDEVWLKDILKRVGEFEIVVSNNDWVLSIFKNAGYPVYESGLFNRDELEGVKIREKMRIGDKNWEKSVPECVVPICIDNSHTL